LFNETKFHVQIPVSTSSGVGMEARTRASLLTWRLGVPMNPDAGY